MKTVVIIISIALAIGYFSSCTSDVALEMVPTDTSCTHGGQDTMRYSADIVPILTTYCTDPGFGPDCHWPGSTGPIPLTTYDAVEAEIEIGNFDYYVLAPTATMPKSTSLGPKDLPPCEKEKLQLWIDQGYPNN